MDTHDDDNRDEEDEPVDGSEHLLVLLAPGPEVQDSPRPVQNRREHEELESGGIDQERDVRTGKKAPSVALIST